MRPYSKYRDSGISWLPSIPQDWLGIKFKFVTSLLTCGHAATPEYIGSDDGVAFLSAQNIKNERIDLTKYNYIKKDLHQRLTKFKKVEKGDLLQVRVGGASTIGQTAIVDVDFDFSIYVSLTHLKLNQSAFNGYIKHLLNSNPFKKLCTAVMKTGAGVANLNVSDLEILKIPLPPISEQIQIAQYLDHKTAQIDKLITDKEKLIELLHEERTVIINQTVTKGLNPDAPMKDSGIEWLGEVPEHWEVLRLRYLVEYVKTGNTPPSDIPEYFEPKEIDWFTPGDFKSLFLDNSNRKISKKAIEDGKCRMFPASSVLIIGIGATLGKIGLISKPASCNQQINAIVFNESRVNSHYGALFLHSYSEVTVSRASSATLAILNQNQTKDLIITVPPLAEQASILDTILEEENKFDSLSSKIEQEIQLLKEYKTALISEVVTGKVDVRDEVIAESTELVY